MRRIALVGFLARAGGESWTDAEGEAPEEGEAGDAESQAGNAGAEEGAEAAPGEAQRDEDRIELLVATSPRAVDDSHNEGQQAASAQIAPPESATDRDTDNDSDTHNASAEDGQLDEDIDGDEDGDEGSDDEGSDDDAEPPLPRLIAPAALDAQDVAQYLEQEVARLLAESGVLEPVFIEVSGEIDPGSPEELGELAQAAGAELALGGYLRVTFDSLELAVVFAGAGGELRAHWSYAMPLGQGPWAAQRLAREVLLAAGEDASAAPELLAAPVAPDVFLALCRAARLLTPASGREPGQEDGEKKDATDEGGEDARATDAGGEDTVSEDTVSEEQSAREVPGLRLADANDACNDLLAVLEAAPELTQARDLLLEGAQAAVGGEAMPAFLAALTQLCDLRPQDASAQLALGEYRMLHLDAEGARELFLSARDNAENTEQEAAALSRLAQLAEDAGRGDEAVQHLRAAARLEDDPGFYLRLGELLRERDPAESLRAFLRAVVLSPEDPTTHLGLAQALRDQGDLTRAAGEASVAAQLASREPALAAQAEALLKELQES